jgi:hypothetical protein
MFYKIHFICELDNVRKNSLYGTSPFPPTITMRDFFYKTVFMIFFQNNFAKKEVPTFVVVLVSCKMTLLYPLVYRIVYRYHQSIIIKWIYSFRIISETEIQVDCSSKIWLVIQFHLPHFRTGIKTLIDPTFLWRTSHRRCRTSKISR